MLAAGLTLILILAGCSQTATSEQRMARATELVSAGDFGAASVELKKLLQSESDHQEARRLLGYVHIQLGDGASAEKELIRARELGLPAARTADLLATAYIMQRAYDKALGELAVDGVSGADILVLRGQALLGKGEAAEAQRAFESARTQAPDSVQPWIGLVRVAFARNSLDEANRLLAEAQKIAPKDVELHLMMAASAEREGDFATAEGVYRKIADDLKAPLLSERGFRAHIGLVNAQILQNKKEEAAVTLAKLTKAMPSHPEVKYADAWLAYQKGEYLDSITKLLDMQKTFGVHLPGQLLLGSAYYATGQYEQANIQLTQFVNAVPTHIQGRKLLAATRLRLNRPEDALETLQKAQGADASDAQLLVMAGRAAAMSGRNEASVNYLRSAVAAAPDNLSIRAELARAYLVQGNVDEAITELQKQGGAQGDDRQRQLLLIGAYLRKNDIASARKAAQTLADQTPDDPAIFMVQGEVELHAGSRPAARRYFNRVLSAKPDHVAAHLQLGRLELEDGNPAGAVERFDLALASNQASVPAMLGHAQVADLRGDRTLALQWLERARSADAKAIVPRLVLARHYLGMRRNDAALEVASEAVSIRPQDPAALVLLGKAQLSAGNSAKAITTLQELVNRYPEVPAGYVELAAALGAGGEAAKARAALEKALSLAPGFLDAQVSLVNLELRAGRLEAALKEAITIQREHANSPVGFGLAGDIHMFGRKYQEAQPAYEQALAKGASSAAVVRLASAYSLGGKRDKAVQVLSTAVASHPDDVDLRMSLGSVYQEKGDMAAAEKHYRHILTLDAGNAAALNNLALVYLPRDRDRAVTLARQAYAIAPQSAAILDTLGWILLEMGQVAEARPLLAKAATQIPAPTVHYHYAVALAREGATTEARRVLEKIMASKAEFNERGDAKTLLVKLGG
jgi:putative PEP-CTERM system TPR-repeat lipoprotein